MTSMLVAGVGNVFLGDDGFGVEVVRRLHERRTDAWPPNVRVIDYGIRGIDLYYTLLDGVDLAILVDATHRDGPPGTLYIVEPSTKNNNDGFEGDASPVLLSPHDLDPAKVLQAVQAMGGEVGRIVLIGCEPESLGTEDGQEGRMGLSAPVAVAVDKAVDTIETMIESMQAQTTSVNAGCVSQDHWRA
ncbi:Hydrogenase 2 maturation protease [Caballeronia sp. SBC1]|uniref:hydrogenase maturation protease n=1 Tax=unclassified Caballeronia TaxID=2646786 RepID=UPI0013E1DB7C|nr:MULTISPECIES: hydrogenase maturation protease [unclassified Caballeronia]QIE23780.1 Hydrogenase 2 maturation protease [Caballeronia sp. SBC2]QIN61677.1 Hydrogenase 2 maturation protease [Caballeronia sp. SBC1]